MASYGQVARLAGLAGHARQVGYTLHTLPAGSRVPWHRVVNVRGEIVVRDAGALPTLAPGRQRALLEAEGVGFNARGRVVMVRYEWRGGRERPAPRGQGRSMEPPGPVGPPRRGTRASSPP